MVLPKVLNRHLVSSLQTSLRAFKLRQGLGPGSAGGGIGGKVDESAFGDLQLPAKQSKA
jgi:hypothetical protein